MWDEEYTSEALYTEVLKNILYGYIPEEDLPNMTISQICEAAIPHVFDTDIPFFDESYRIPLEKKILMHYYVREIGAETETRFKFYLNQTLREEMPFFNQLYESELIKFDPLKNYLQDEQKVSNIDTDDNIVSIDSESKNYQEGNIDKTVLSNQESNIGQEKILSTDNNIIKRDQDENGTQFNKDTTVSNNESKSISLEDTGSQEDITGNPTSHDETTSETKSISGMLDTPQGALTGLTNAMDALDGNTTGTAYLTSGSAAKSNSEGETDHEETLDQHTATKGSTSGLQSNNGSDNSESDSYTLNTNRQSENETSIANGEEMRSSIDSKNEDETREQTTLRSGKDAKDKSNVRSGKEKSTEAYLLKVAGMRGNTPSKMLMEFRETFLNIDKMVIDSVADCFMGVY